MATRQITGVYDLSENVLDVWHELHPDSDNAPDKEELAYLRQAIQLHYRWTGRRLGEGHRVQFDECGTWSLPLRKAKKVRDFRTGETFIMPEYLEMEFNAEPTVEASIGEAFTPPSPNVK